MGRSKEFVTVTDDGERGVLTFTVAGLGWAPPGAHSPGTAGFPGGDGALVCDGHGGAGLGLRDGARALALEPNRGRSCGVPAASNRSTSWL